MLHAHSLTGPPGADVPPSHPRARPQVRYLRSADETPRHPFARQEGGAVETHVSVLSSPRPAPCHGVCPQLGLLKGPLSKVPAAENVALGPGRGHEQRPECRCPSVHVNGVSVKVQKPAATGAQGVRQGPRRPAAVRHGWRDMSLGRDGGVCTLGGSLRSEPQRTEQTRGLGGDGTLRSHRGPGDLVAAIVNSSAGPSGRRSAQVPRARQPAPFPGACGRGDGSREDVSTPRHAEHTGGPGSRQPSPGGRDAQLPRVSVPGLCQVLHAHGGDTGNQGLRKQKVPPGGGGGHCPGAPRTMWTVANGPARGTGTRDSSQPRGGLTVAIVRGRVDTSGGQREGRSA